MNAPLTVTCKAAADHYGFGDHNFAKYLAGLQSPHVRISGTGRGRKFYIAASAIDELANGYRANRRAIYSARSRKAAAARRFRSVTVAPTTMPAGVGALGAFGTAVEWHRGEQQSPPAFPCPVGVTVRPSFTDADRARLATCEQLLERIFAAIGGSL